MKNNILYILIAAAIAGSQSAGIPVKLEMLSNASSRYLEIGYAIEKEAPRNVSMNLAVVEDGLVREIGSGENRGLTLHHEAVVRAFASIKLNGKTSDKLRLSIPADMKRENSGIIGFPQNSKSLRILGAGRVEQKP